MNALSKHVSAAVVSGLFVLAVGQANAGVWYQETFPNGTGNDLPPTTAPINWNVHITSFGFADTFGTSAVKPTAGDGGVPGFLFSDAGNGSFLGPTLMWTSDFTPITTSDVTTVTWYQGNELKTDQYRLALRIGSNWYASDKIPGQATDVDLSKFDEEGTDMSVILASLAGWQTLNFTPGTTLALGGATAAPSGTIDAIGLFIESPNGFRAIDSFTVNAVPEPTSLILTGLGFTGVLGWVGWRRRKGQGTTTVQTPSAV